MKQKRNIIFVSKLNSSQGFEQALMQAGCELRYDVKKKDLVLRFGEIGWVHPHFRNLTDRGVQPDGWMQRYEALSRAFIVFFKESVAQYRVNAKGVQYPDYWHNFNKDTFRMYGWNCVSDVKYHGDSFLDYLNSIPEWDGVERLDYFLRDGLGVDYLRGDAIEYFKHCSRQPWINAINRANNPGAKCDEMLTFVGEQGLGKSQVIANLSPPEWHKFWVLSDYEPTAKAQDLITDAHPCVFMEMGEVDQVAKYTSNNKLKRMLSRQFDVARLPWHESSERAERQFVCLGSANDQGEGVLYDDPSGNRRFLVVQCNSSKDQAVGYLNENREQLWAEALVQWKNGVSLYLPDSLAHVRDTLNEQFVAEDPIEDRIKEALEEGLFQKVYENRIANGESRHRANHFTVQEIAEVILFARPYPVEEQPKQNNGQYTGHSDGFEHFDPNDTDTDNETFGEFHVLTHPEKTAMGKALGKLKKLGFLKKFRWMSLHGKQTKKPGYLVPVTNEEK